eukprot:3811256-Prymnesium_polylepis.1
MAACEAAACASRTRASKRLSCRDPVAAIRFRFCHLPPSKRRSPACTASGGPETAQHRSSFASRIASMGTAATLASTSPILSAGTRSLVLCGVGCT